MLAVDGCGGDDDVVVNDDDGKGVVKGVVKGEGLIIVKIWNAYMCKSGIHSYHDPSKEPRNQV